MVKSIQQALNICEIHLFNLPPNHVFLIGKTVGGESICMQKSRSIGWFKKSSYSFLISQKILYIGSVLVSFSFCKVPYKNRFTKDSYLYISNGMLPSRKLTSGHCYEKALFICINIFKKCLSWEQVTAKQCFDTSLMKLT